MTTGSVSRGDAYGPYYYSRVWNGANGKYEQVGPRKRSKWNNYTLSFDESFGSPSTKGFYCNISGCPTFASVFPTSLSFRNQSNIVSAVKGHNFNMAVAAAEGRQTVSLVTNACSTIAQSLIHLRHGNLAMAMRRLGIDGGSHLQPVRARDVGRVWLELQYGWKPLLSDVAESAKAFSALSDPPRVERIVVSQTHNQTYNGSQSSSNYSGFGPLRATERITCELSESLSAPRSLGLLDPLSVAWELMPYSFVVDWFIPIGSYLENLNTIPNLQGRFLTTQFLHYENSLSGTGSVGYYVGASGRSKHVRLSRSVSSSLAAVKPSFKPVDKALSSSHIWNGLALLQQACATAFDKSRR